MCTIINLCTIFQVFHYHDMEEKKKKVFCLSLINYTYCCRGSSMSCPDHEDSTKL